MLCMAAFSQLQLYWGQWGCFHCKQTVQRVQPQLLVLVVPSPVYQNSVHKANYPANAFSLPSLFSMPNLNIHERNYEAWSWYMELSYNFFHQHAPEISRVLRRETSGGVVGLGIDTHHDGAETITTAAEPCFGQGERADPQGDTFCGRRASLCSPAHGSRHQVCCFLQTFETRHELSYSWGLGLVW